MHIKGVTVYQCGLFYHHKCSGLSVVRCREADNYQCRRCRPQNPTHLCTKCGRSFRIGQNGLTCHSCNLPTHLKYTRLHGMSVKEQTRALSWICCLHPTMSNDQETDDQNDDVNNNNRASQGSTRSDTKPLRSPATTVAPTLIL